MGTRAALNKEIIMKSRSLKTSLVALAISAAALTAGSAAMAGGEDPGAWKIGGGATWTFPDGKRDLLDGAGYSVWVGQVINEKWDWDLNYFNANLNIENNNSARFHSNGYSDSLKGFGLDLDRVYGRSSSFSPFITMGFGYIDDGRDPGYDELFVKLGVGALLDLVHFNSGGVLQLKAEAYGRYQFADVLDGVVGLGLQYAWGGRAPVVAAVAPPPPPPPPVVQAPPPPPPVIDSDGDGVPDSADRCLNTPKGDRVGVNGCSCDVTVQVHFKSNSAVITEGDKVDLDRVAANLTALGFVSGTIVGYTDSVGSDAFNQALSERRAKAVAAYLESKGIATGRIVPSGAGESQPVADNATEEGRAQNRRVVLSRTDCGR
jgi:OmpA-OmpF porin, OOP family